MYGKKEKLWLTYKYKKNINVSFIRFKIVL